MEIIENIKGIFRTETPEQKKLKDAKSQAKSVLKDQERKLKEEGVDSRAVVLDSGENGYVLRWDYRAAYGGHTNGESKSVRVTVKPDATFQVEYGEMEQIAPDVPKFTRHSQVESRPEYALAEKSAKLLAQEFGEKPEDVNNSGLTLDKRIEVAMRFAQHVSDGRYDTSIR